MRANLVRAVCEVDLDDAANARLIAAAPDLLAAAVLATGYVQASIDMATSPDFKLAATDALAKLRAALAAARGEA